MLNRFRSEQRGEVRGVRMQTLENVAEYPVFGLIESFT